MTQAQLAELIGKSTATVGQYERGEIWPTCEVFFMIVDFFNIDVGIFDLREKPQYDTETHMMLNLFSQMNEVEKNGINKFLRGLTEVSNYMEHKQMHDSEYKEIT